MPRANFPKSVIREIAARAGYVCSNPSCGVPTAGPASGPRGSINLGVAAHISAAAPGGPRFDPVLTAVERRSIDNAIWLCQSCATLIDRDVQRFSIEVLRNWRELAEHTAALRILAPSRYRPIADGELRHELSVGERVVVKQLGEEFGCEVKTDVAIPAGEGWVNLHAAAVRGDDLVAIDIHEHHGRGIPDFQVEYLIDLCRKLEFPRFKNVVIYVAVVSDADEGADEVLRERLDRIAAATAVEVHVRIYRLNALRARFGL